MPVVRVREIELCTISANLQLESIWWSTNTAFISSRDVFVPVDNLGVSRIARLVEFFTKLLVILKRIDSSSVFALYNPRSSKWEALRHSDLSPSPFKFSTRARTPSCFNTTLSIQICRWQDRAHISVTKSDPFMSFTMYTIRVSTNLFLYSATTSAVKVRIVVMRSTNVESQRTIPVNLFGSFLSLISLASLIAILYSQTMRRAWTFS